MTVIVHVAAKPVGMVQRCALCGVVLMDRNEVVLATTGQAPPFWRGNVELITDELGRPCEAGETDQAPTCQRRGH